MHILMIVLLLIALIGIVGGFIIGDTPGKYNGDYGNSIFGALITGIGICVAVINFVIFLFWVFSS